MEVKDGSLFFMEACSLFLSMEANSLFLSMEANSWKQAEIALPWELASHSLLFQGGKQHVIVFSRKQPYFAFHNLASSLFCCCCFFLDRSKISFTTKSQDILSQILDAMTSSYKSKCIIL